MGIQALTPGAVVMLILVQATFTFMCVYFFLRVLRTPPKSPDSFYEEDEDQNAEA